MFGGTPLGCIALSQLLPDDKNKPMYPPIKTVLYEKFQILKERSIECQGFSTKGIKNVITRDTL